MEPTAALRTADVGELHPHVVVYLLMGLWVFAEEDYDPDCKTPSRRSDQYPPTYVGVCTRPVGAGDPPVRHRPHRSACTAVRPVASLEDAPTSMAGRLTVRRERGLGG